MSIIKYLFVTLAAAAITLSPAMAQDKEPQDSTGLAGDNFSLQGALDIFEKSESPEAFEQALNEENNSVNNLDLDGDGQVDYVRVIDKTDGDVHALILQVAVSETENQDIAVIEIEKNGDASAMLQIIGDEEIYGDQLIIEPDGDGEEDGTYMEHFTISDIGGPNAEAAFNPTGIIVNVWMWPSVRFIFRPAYRPWVSPWRWHRYPSAWHPWRPYAWHTWYPRRQVYHARPFVVVRTHRVVRAHRIYTPVRVTSVTVRNRHAVAMNHYKVTRTKTTVTGPRGNTGVRRTTTVTGPGGRVKARKTSVHRRRG
jgi:hypothetical protein